MSENVIDDNMSDLDDFLSYLDNPDPLIHIIARGDFGKRVLDSLVLPDAELDLVMDLVIIEYTDKDIPIYDQSRPKVKITIEISDTFDVSSIRQGEKRAGLNFFIGAKVSNPAGLITREDNNYFVYSQSIEEYRELISILISMCCTTGWVHNDVYDVMAIFSVGTVGIIASSSYREGEPDSGRANLVAQETIENLMKKSLYLKQVKSCLVCMTVGFNFTLDEFRSICDEIFKVWSDEIKICVGTSLDVDSEGILVTAVTMI